MTVRDDLVRSAIYAVPDADRLSPDDARAIIRAYHLAPLLEHGRALELAERVLMLEANVRALRWELAGVGLAALDAVRRQPETGESLRAA